MAESTEAVKEVIKEEKPRDVQLSPARHQETEHANHDWTVTAESGTTVEDVLKPLFWAHVSPKLSPYDKVRVRTDDGMWYGEFLVLTAGRTWAKVIKLFDIKLQTSDVDQSQAHEFDGYKIENAGPHLKWRVVRKQDSKAVTEGCASKTEAEIWLRQHIKTTS